MPYNPTLSLPKSTSSFRLSCDISGDGRIPDLCEHAKIIAAQEGLDLRRLPAVIEQRRRDRGDLAGNAAFGEIAGAHVVAEGGGISGYGGGIAVERHLDDVADRGQ